MSQETVKLNHPERKADKDIEMETMRLSEKSI